MTAKFCDHVGIIKDGLLNVYDQNVMGVLADHCANKYEFSRDDQDKYALQSYSRSSEAWEKGKFDEEVIPVEIKDRRGNITIVNKDEEEYNCNVIDIFFFYSSIYSQL